MNLIEFARLFNLTEMEKQAYILNKVIDVAILLQYNVIEWLLVTIATFKVGIKSEELTKKK